MRVTVQQSSARFSGSQYRSRVRTISSTPRLPASLIKGAFSEKRGGPAMDPVVMPGIDGEGVAAGIARFVAG